MDFFAADWIFETDTIDAAFIPKWQMNSIDASVDSLYNVNTSSPSSNTTDPISRRTQSAPNYEVTETDVYAPGNNTNIAQKRLIIQKANYSNSPTAKIIAFGDASANKMVKIDGDAAPGSLGEMSFQDPISPTSIQKLYTALEYGEPAPRRSITRTTLEAQDHVIAERKRREKLSELFVSLSAIIPDLKKLDKASILGGAIEHLKELEERLKTLEKEQKKRKNEKSSVVSSYVKRPKVTSNDDSSSSNETINSSLDQSLPEIEVRTCDGNVLLRVYCKKRTGIIKEILCEVEKLGFCIINSSAMPFGDTILHMSVIAQMDGDFCLLDEGIPEKVRQAILKLL